MTSTAATTIAAIERELDLAASPDRVWRALTDSSEVALGTDPPGPPEVAATAAGIDSPGWPIQATIDSTGTVTPSGASMRSRTPSSKASISMFDLSVSISKSGSPRTTLSPSFLNHWRTVHSSVICPGMGMRMATAIR
jgi:hypothetical protein